MEVREEKAKRERDRDTERGRKRKNKKKLEWLKSKETEGGLVGEQIQYRRMENIKLSNGG